MLLIDTGLPDKLNLIRRLILLFKVSSDLHSVFFCASNKSKDKFTFSRAILQNSRTNGTFFQIPGVFPDQSEIQGVFKVCAKPEYLCSENKGVDQLHRYPAADPQHLNFSKASSNRSINLFSAMISSLNASKC